MAVNAPAEFDAPPDHQASVEVPASTGRRVTAPASRDPRMLYSRLIGALF